MVARKNKTGSRKTVRKKPAHSRTDNRMRDAAVAVLVLSAAILLIIGFANNCSTTTPIENSSATKSISGSYSGHYSEVPKSNSLDWNGDMSFIISSDNNVTARVVTKGGNEFANQSGSVNGTELLVIMLPEEKEHINGRENTCIIIGAFSDAADSITGIVTCDDVNNTAAWTATRVP